MLNLSGPGPPFPPNDFFTQARQEQRKALEEAGISLLTSMKGRP